MKWQEFWDSFDPAIHLNESISLVEKTNDLRAKVEGEAAEETSGLTATIANYQGVLQKRFGQNEIIFNAHVQKAFLPVRLLKTEMSQDLFG